MKRKSNMKCTFVILFASITLLAASCEKGFLEKKPDSSIVLLSSIEDLWNLLDNHQVMNYTSSLPQLSADEYFIISDDVFDGLIRETQRNAYIWADNPYGSETTVASWNYPYTGIFYANSVLDALENARFSSFPVTEKNPVKGSALFMRAYLFFDLLRTFAPVYDPANAHVDPGIPIRLEPDIDYTAKRSSVAASYDQIFSDLASAKGLLPNATSPIYLNRPSVCAVYALMARIHLERAEYELASHYADSALTLKKSLIDFNSLDSLSERPFANAPDEVIYYTQLIGEFNTTQYSVNTQGYIGIDPELLRLYDSGDLRAAFYFQGNSSGNFSVKRGYATGIYPFTGLAVDEIYLIRAEALARIGNRQLASQVLDELLVKRYLPGTYPGTANLAPEDLINRILEERRKELVWRGMRWHDLRRLNKEGREIHLYRTVHGQQHHLLPNDPRYTFPIPPEEIQLSGLEQNKH